MNRICQRLVRRRPYGLKLHRLPSYVSTNFMRYNSSHPTVEFLGDQELLVDNWDRGGKTERNSLTPLYASMKQLIDKNVGSVCLIQVGSFYELYFDQAEIYGPKLGLKVTTRKTTNYAISMAGFPVSQLQKFVKVLVQDIQVNVAIVDQFPEEQLVGSKIIHRKISRIISPGTLVDEIFLNYNMNNYLLAVSFPPNCHLLPYDPDLTVGLSWIDVSVGDFYVQSTSLKDLKSDISRINPSEIIISKDFSLEELISWWPPLNDFKRYFLRHHKTIYNDLKLLFSKNLNSVRKIIETFNVREEAAMNMVLSYININLPEKSPSLDLPVKYWNNKFLQMDSRTRDSLELIERTGGISGKSLTVGSLLNTIKRTSTTSGTRLLTEWIKSPILDTNELVNRQDFVKFFLQFPHQTLIIEGHLKHLGDFARAGQRLALGTGDVVSNLKAMGDGIKVAFELKQFFNTAFPENDLICEFLKGFETPIELSKIINETFLDSFHTFDDKLDEFRELKKLFTIKPNHSKSLSETHNQLQELRAKECDIFQNIKNQIEEIDDALTILIKEQHGKFNDVIYVNGKIKSIESISELFANEVKEKRKNSLLLKSKAWKIVQYEINEVIDKIQNIEKSLIDDLKKQVIDELINIRKTSKKCDFLDVTLSFSKLTREFNMCCPEFSQEPELLIEDGRHIVVESSLKDIGSNFIANSTSLNPQKENMWIISGPNMGGKSTFLRQNAIIIILAQIGCFVPARKCRLGPTDRIFTRIGASDDLFNDLSTFMVEMIEVTNILNNATPRSLAVVDEVGRGTSGKEGLAIAYSTMVSLHKYNQCRTLFATHYGQELYDILVRDNPEVMDNVGFYKTGVVTDRLDNDKIKMVLDHKLVPGISEKSFAIEIAQLSGFPKESLALATKTLAKL